MKSPHSEWNNSDVDNYFIILIDRNIYTRQYFRKIENFSKKNLLFEFCEIEHQSHAYLVLQKLALSTGVCLTLVAFQGVRSVLPTRKFLIGIGYSNTIKF